MHPLLNTAKCLGIICVSENVKLEECYKFISIFSMISFCLCTTVTVVRIINGQYIHSNAIIAIGDSVHFALMIIATLFCGVYYYLRRKTTNKVIYAIQRYNSNEEMKLFYPWFIIIVSFGGDAILLANTRYGIELINVVHYMWYFYIDIQVFVFVAFSTNIARTYKKFRQQNPSLNTEFLLNYVFNQIEKHTEYLEVTEEFVRLFLPPLVSILIVNFVDLIFGLHFHISAVISHANGDTNDLVVTLWALYADSIVFMMICLIIYGYSLVEIEANKASTYVHDIWNRLASRNEIDDQVNYLQLISLQLYNTRLKFTAYGFFGLDWTLLQRIIAAITTYVVILIQFGISSSSRAVLSQIHTNKSEVFGNATV